MESISDTVVFQIELGTRCDAVITVGGKLGKSIASVMKELKIVEAIC